MPDDLKRTGFGLRLMQLARLWRQAVDAGIRRDAFPDAGWRPLVYLYRASEPLRQKDLAALIGIEGPSLVRLLDSLVASGLVLRAEDPEDRRARRLALTPSGLTTARRIEVRLAEVEAELLRQVDGSALKAAMDALGQIELALRRKPPAV
ncbi:MarR family transcriptional regulator [Pseudoroseomonas wenyumeiae]|uniref:MarR family transcriptional regulator n=1 Tax=Teichococcus wenyumeiae TaxID=2478470 RepID=A0A3A9JMR3_9PROT|nr:MarR family transcriptional regulator [Pseudoroseomonas wenyumeiae]RKK05835.1 MarR family transcriptional regulator [Pseudoroseomonas wenyumeiae]RMI25669.1 MarR family transcriptional regulator [Pseudoroseomonas wenyumeiae]